MSGLARLTRLARLARLLSQTRSPPEGTFPGADYDADNHQVSFTVVGATTSYWYDGASLLAQQIRKAATKVGGGGMTDNEQEWERLRTCGEILAEELRYKCGRDGIEWDAELVDKLLDGAEKSEP